jgi:hypothetical protein
MVCVVSRKLLACVIAHVCNENYLTPNEKRVNDPIAKKKHGGAWIAAKRSGTNTVAENNAKRGGERERENLFLSCPLT